MRTVRKAYPTTLEGGVESDEVLSFHRHTWVAERVGWVALALLFLAGALGLLGGGPLAHRTLAGRGFVLHYEAFTRIGAHEALTLHLPPRGEAVRVGIATAYLDGVRIEDTLPQPVRVAAAGPWTTFTFALEPGGPARLVFRVAPSRFGVLSGAVRVDGGEPLAFRQLVYP